MEHGAGKVPGFDEAEGSAATIEIKIKTLDSQTYTMRVDKQMPIPSLKEQIASVTGVLSEQQRLICRGKVLKDDQLLSAYHVEDGHTLHLVVRHPVPPSQSSLNNPETDPASSTLHGHSVHGTPSVVIEAFSIPHQGDAFPSEISRIISTVLSSFGFPNIGGGIDGLDATRDRGTGMQTEQTGTGRGSDRPPLSAFGFPSAIPFGSIHPPVIQDSLTTLSQYLSHARGEFTAEGSGTVNNSETNVSSRTELRDSSSTRQSETASEGLPTPASLAEVLLSSRQLFVEEVAERLLQLGRQLESQATVTDPAIRLTTQSYAWRTGYQLYNLGAFLLELGRATMTLRLGQSPTEAVVNAGPAVFINSSGPNPLMVQPIPFQLGTTFGNTPIGSVQPGSGLRGGIGSGFLPRRIDIQIRRGPSAATSTDNQQERGDAQQPSGQRNAAAATGNDNTGSQSSSRVSDGLSPGGEPGVHVAPIRTMVATIPAPLSHLPFESSSNSMGLYVPVLGRFQQASAGDLSSGQPSRGEHHPDGVQTEQRSFAEPDQQLPSFEQRIRDVIRRLRDVNSGHASNEQGPHVSPEQQSAPGPAIQQPITDHHTGDGSIPSSTSRQPNSSSVRSISIDILSTGGAENNEESTQHVPESMFLHFLRNIYPESEVHREDVSTGPATTGAVPESSEPLARHVDPDPGSGVTDEGIFFSTLLQQITPVISQHIDVETQAMAPGESSTLHHHRGQDSATRNESCDVGASRRASESDADMPNSKRQKME